MRYCVECGKGKPLREYERMGLGERRGICRDCMKVLAHERKQQRQSYHGTIGDPEAWDVPASRIPDVRCSQAMERGFPRGETPYIEWLKNQIRVLRIQHSDRLYRRRKYERDGEKEKAKAREVYAEDPERWRERHRKYREANREKERERKRRYYQRHKEYVKQYQREYRRRKREEQDGVGE